MSDGSQSCPPYSNSTSSLPVLNPLSPAVSNGVNANVGTVHPTSLSHSTANTQPQAVDEYAVLERLFYDEMKMMDSVSGNSGSGLLNNMELNCLIENNTELDKSLANSGNNSSSTNMSTTSHLPSFGSNHLQKTNSNSINNHNMRDTDPNQRGMLGNSNGLDVDQHARFLGSTAITSMSNSNYDSMSSSTKPPTTTPMNPTLMHHNSPSLHPISSRQQQHQHQQSQIVQNNRKMTVNQTQHGHGSTSNKTTGITQPIQPNGNIHIPTHKHQHQHLQPHSQSNQTLMGQGQQRWTSPPQAQQSSVSPIGNQIPSQPSMPTQNQSHTHQKNFSVPVRSHQGLLSTPILPHPQKIQDKTQNGNIHQTKQQQLGQQPQLQHPSNHQQHQQRHLNQLHHPLTGSLHHRSPLNSPTLQLLTPSQQIQNTSIPTQNQTVQQKQKENKMLQNNHQQQQARPIQQPFQIQSKPNHSQLQQHFHTQVQQLRQPPQLQTPQQYQSAPKNQQNNQQQQQFRPNQQLQQPVPLTSHQSYQTQPQLQQKPQQQQQQLQQPQLQPQPQLPLHAQPTVQTQQPYQLQHHSTQQTLPKLQPQQQFLSTQKIPQPKSNQSQQQLQNPQQKNPQHSQLTQNLLSSKTHIEQPLLSHKMHQVQQKQQFQAQPQVHQLQQMQPQQQLQHPSLGNQSHNNQQPQVQVQNVQQYQINKQIQPVQQFKNPLPNQYHAHPGNMHLLKPPSTRPPENNLNHSQTTTLDQAQKVQQPEERARSLVSQFATLATQLGISLPPSVFTSLTKAATIREESSQNIDPKLTMKTVPEVTITSGNNETKSEPQAQGSNVDVTMEIQDLSRRVSNKSSTGLEPLLQQKQNSSVPLKNQSITFNPKLQISHLSSLVPTTLKPVSFPPKVLEDPTKAIKSTETSYQTNALKNATVRKWEETANAAIATISSAKNQDLSSSVNSGEKSNGEAGSNRPQPYRKRKRPRLEECVAKLASLRSENDTLKRHLAIVANKTQKFDLEREEAERVLGEMVKNNSTTSDDMTKILEKFTRMYSDFGQHRQEELMFHLNQLEKSAVPTNFTKMSLWTLSQDNEFFCKPKRNAISGILMEELGITFAQGKKIIEHREKIKSICSNIKEALSLLTTLKLLCEHKQNVFKARMTKCQEILTPLQVGKLLLWLNENSGLLEQVCPGWGAERVKNKSIEVVTSTSETELAQGNNEKNTSCSTGENELTEEFAEIGAGDDSDDSSTGSMK